MNVSHGIIWKPWPVVVRKAHLVLIRPAVLHIPFHLRPFPPGTLALSCGPLPPLASHSPPACVLPCFSLSRGVRGSLAGLGCPCLGKSPPTAEAGRRAGGVGWGEQLREGVAAVTSQGSLTFAAAAAAAGSRGNTKATYAASSNPKFKSRLVSSPVSPGGTGPDHRPSTSPPPPL